MERLTFEKLPEAVASLLEKIDRIESILSSFPLSQEMHERMNIKQAAEFLDCKVPTIYAKVSRREIPVNKQGKRLYFYKSELESWIKQGRKKTLTEAHDSVQLPLKRKW